MSVNEPWPYVTDSHKVESEEHIRMKNLAIEWLLDFGFEIEDVEVEKTVRSSSGGYGFTDVYAERDGFEVFVECERGSPIKGDLSRGGSIPAKDGKLVYFLNRHRLYRVRYEMVEVEVGHNYVSPTLASMDGTVETKTFTFDRLGPVPERGKEYEHSPEAQRRERNKVSWL